MHTDQHTSDCANNVCCILLLLVDEHHAYAQVADCCSGRCLLQVLSNPNSFDVAVTTYEMVNSADFGRPIQTSIVSSAVPCS
jgi:hypothetical protein